ncbi:MAG TPA: outer membrane protein transport protein [Verrucomicrobiae bacterium]|nr:outer membrane protein transport protein [Verrucomicrobiae bacterium]
MKNKSSRWIKSGWDCQPVGLTFLLGLSFIFLTPTNSPAGAFRLPNQDPEAIARGDAEAATADNPSAIYYNPAGITQLTGQNVRVGLYVISPGEKYTSPSGVTATAKSDPEPVPQVYYVNTFTNMPISVGVGMYCPYGLSLDWGDNTPFNTVAEKGSLLYLSFNPVIAWKVCPTLSIGVGPTINYSKATVEQAIPLGSGQLKFDGDGVDYGFNAGILWQPHPMWSFGVNYRSATDIHYQGTASQTFGPPFPASTQTKASVKFPQFVVGGISFRPTPDWNFEFDLDWADWSSVKQIDFENTPFGTIPLTLDFKSSFMYEFGITRQLGRGYFASVGYIYNENSSPDANFTPLIPDAALQLGSLGFGRHGKNWDWAIAYHFGYNGGRTINNPPTAPDFPANGTYKTFNNAVDVAATFKF